MTNGTANGQIWLEGLTNPNLGGTYVEVIGTPCGVLTQPNGAYSIPNIPQGFYTIKAQRPNYEPGFSPTFQIIGGQTANVFNFTLKPIPAIISGEARLEGSTLKSGILMKVAGTSFMDMTDEAGHYKIQVSTPGTYSLQAIKDGWKTRSIQVTASPGGQTNPETLQLEINRGSCNGMIRLEGKGPTENDGTLVSVCGLGGYDVMTLPNGNYTIQNIPVGWYTIKAFRQGFEPWYSPTIKIERDQPTSVENPPSLKMIGGTSTPTQPPSSTVSRVSVTNTSTDMNARTTDTKSTRKGFSLFKSNK